MATTHGGQRFEQLIFTDAASLQQLSGRRPLRVHQPNEQVLRRHVRIAQLLGQLVGVIERLGELTCRSGTPVPALCRQPIDLSPNLRTNLAHAQATLLQHGNDDSLLLP